MNEPSVRLAGRAGDLACRLNAQCDTPKINRMDASGCLTTNPHAQSLPQSSMGHELTGSMPRLPQANQGAARTGCKVAVVTPYFRTDPEKILRCCDSVKRQTIKCEHILLADGESQDLPADHDVIQMVLPANVGNCGPRPRGFGGQYAFAQGYDAVAFPDPDKWYDPEQVEVAVQAPEANKRDVVFARRDLIFLDRETLKIPDPQDESGFQGDTNCYILFRRAAFMLGVWTLWPKKFGTGEDRAMKQAIDKRELRCVWLNSKTVWSETNWRKHYWMAHKKAVAPLRAPLRSFKNSWSAGEFYASCGVSL